MTIHLDNNSLVNSSELPLEFLSQLKNQRVKEKENVRFVCKASKPDLRGKWKKDGDELAASEKFDMKADGNEYSLDIINASPDDEGAYSLHLLNKRTSANLTVEGINQQLTTFFLDTVSPKHPRKTNESSNHFFSRTSH